MNEILRAFCIDAFACVCSNAGTTFQYLFRYDKFMFLVL